MSNFKIPLGVEVIWTSYKKTKRGKVIGHLPSEFLLEAVVGHWLAEKTICVPCSNIHGAEASRDDRYVVVSMSPKGHPHFYTPHVSVLEKAMADKIKKHRWDK